MPAKQVVPPFPFTIRVTLGSQARIRPPWCLSPAPRSGATWGPGAPFVNVHGLRRCPSGPDACAFGGRRLARDAYPCLSIGDMWFATLRGIPPPAFMDRGVPRAARVKVPKNVMLVDATSERVRGPGGGYRLARPADQLAVAQIVLAVDEPLETLRCKSKTTGCMPGGERCLTHDLWEALGDHIHGFLSGVSLDDVVQGRLRPSKAA